MTYVEQVERAVEIDEDRFLYGIIAEFEHAEDVVKAAQRAHDAGFRKMDAYTPFPVEGLSEALGFRDVWVPILMLLGGAAGCIGGYCFIAWATVVAYPLNIGGRPLYGWPSFIPVTFELTVLLSALSGILGMFILNGLPMPYHPVFDAPEFERASSDRFYLCIESQDPRFDHVETRRFMDTLGAITVADVELKK